MTMSNPTILIIDGAVRAELYEMWLADDYPVQTASSRKSALSKIDKTVAVVFLRHELRADLKEQVETKLEATSPAGQIAMTTSEHTEILFPEVSCAKTLCEPITEAKLTTTAKTLLDRARYHEALRQYYRLSILLTNCEVSDGDDLQNKKKDLQRRNEQLATQLKSLHNQLDIDERQAVLESLKPQLTLPKQADNAPRSTSKFRPDRCRECGLLWGVDHGGDLGDGYQSLGAYAWKCQRCRTVQNIATPSDRAVARRFSS